MLKYLNIIILLFSIFNNNAFILTHVNKINLINTKHIKKNFNILMNKKIKKIKNNNSNNSQNNINNEVRSFYKMLKKRSINNNNDTDDEFPSFYEFLRKRSINNNIVKKNFAINPSSKNLKLITSFITLQFAQTWVYEMIHLNSFFPTFMYQDMHKMRDFSRVNISKQYFYISYYPPYIDSNKGPYYIAAFELNSKEREFITHIIIQNPNYCVENIYDNEQIINFKKQLEALCSDATVFFKYSNLNNTSLKRYYYSWLYE
jgi:hypothetical protein